MRKMFLLATTGLFLGYETGAAEAGSIRDRDVSTQHEVASGRSQAAAPAPAAAASKSNPYGSDYGLAPGFVTPYGYPLPPYADGNNFQTIYTGR